MVSTVCGASWWDRKKTSEQVTGHGFSLCEFEFARHYDAAVALWSQSGPGIHVGRSDSPEEIMKKLNRDPDLFLVAETGGKLIGTVIGGYDGRRGMVYHLAVQPDQRRKGVGRALMAELERRLRARGCIRSYLMVVPGNQAVADYYQSLGWEVLPVITYAKDLSE